MWLFCCFLGQASEATGEKLWRMPLAPEYGEQVKSKIADLKNVGARPGSSITAALFLKEFVEKVGLTWIQTYVGLLKEGGHWTG